MSTFAGSIHNRLRNYYLEYKNSPNREEARKWYNKTIWEGCIHAIAEEIVLYPLVRNYFSNGEELADEAIEYHKQLKHDLYLLESTDFNNEFFDLKFTKIMESLFIDMKVEELQILEEVTKQVPLEIRIKASVLFEKRKLIVHPQPNNNLTEKYLIIETIQELLLAPIEKFIDHFKEYQEPQQSASYQN